MNPDRHQQFLIRKERILSVAEKLLLENNQEITLDEWWQSLISPKAPSTNILKVKTNYF